MILIKSFYDALLYYFNTFYFSREIYVCALESLLSFLVLCDLFWSSFQKLHFRMAPFPYVHKDLISKAQCFLEQLCPQCKFNFPLQVPLPPGTDKQSCAHSAGYNALLAVVNSINSSFPLNSPIESLKSLSSSLCIVYIAGKEISRMPVVRLWKECLLTLSFYRHA